MVPGTKPGAGDCVDGAEADGAGAGVAAVVGGAVWWTGSGLAAGFFSGEAMKGNFGSGSRDDSSDASRRYWYCSGATSP